MDTAIKINDLGKLYKLYHKPVDKILDVFGINKFMVWKKTNYQEFWALRGLNLEVKKGERVGIVGRNGAGKSTLLKIISGNINPTEGSVQVNGKVQALMELGTGFHPDFTGRENIKASLSYNNLSMKQIKLLEEEIIDFTELEEFIDQPVKIYSAGMYARLAFAVATVLEPEILIIDEILGAGDASFAMKSAQRMKKLTQETGATVLFVSHSIESVIDMCDRAILLNRGKITHDADPLTISKIYNSMIRAEDELLLRAKESRLRKKDYRALHSLSETVKPLLMRLKTESDHPKSKHFISKIALSNKQDIIAQIDVGAPADNDLNAPNRIIDGIGLMDWGTSIKRGNHYCRPFQNENGLYCHAPFQLCIPVYLLDSDDLVLQIEGEISDDETVYVEYWKDDQYVRLAALNHSGSMTEIMLSEVLMDKKLPVSSDDVPKSNPASQKTVETLASVDVEQSEENKYDIDSLKKNLSVYGTGEMIISKVEVLDRNQQSKRVFFIGEEMTFALTLTSTVSIPSFYLVASILLTDGRPMGQVYCSSRDLGLDHFVGETTVQLTYSPLRFGAGEYMVSIGVFKSYNLMSENEDESYCVLDRAVFFKVQQPETMKKGIGYLANACTWKHRQMEYVYDPINHLKEEAKT